MTHEIERKFLLKEPWTLSSILREYPLAKHFVIEQRYLSNTGSWTTRIRQSIFDGTVSHFMTLKRKINDVRCVELETPISADFYDTMASQCGPPLCKMRYEVIHQGHAWEIDYFPHPVFQGLKLVEIELDDENEKFVIPDWVGQEVTHDKQYKNARLVKRLTDQ